MHQTILVDVSSFDVQAYTMNAKFGHKGASGFSFKQAWLTDAGVRLPLNGAAFVFAGGICVVDDFDVQTLH